MSPLLFIIELLETNLGFLRLNPPKLNRIILLNVDCPGKRLAFPIGEALVMHTLQADGFQREGAEKGAVMIMLPLQMERRGWMEKNCLFCSQSFLSNIPLLSG